jgi:hypothetical protein
VYGTRLAGARLRLRHVIIAVVDAADELAVAWRQLLPLRIESVGYADPHLSIVGNGWALALTGTWFWRAGGLVRAGAGEPDAEDSVWDLCGHDLVGIRSEVTAVSRVVAFAIGDGSLLGGCPGRRGS